MVKSKLIELNLSHITNVDTPQNFAGFKDSLDSSLHTEHNALWIRRVTKEGGTSTGTRNKLRTYSLFKSTFEPELYLKLPLTVKERRVMAKLRCGVAPLHIETGRYCRTPVEQRLCQFCYSNSVEDESHFILQCPVYDHLRLSLFEYVYEVVPNFYSLNDSEKLCIILSHQDIVFKSAKVLKQMLNFRNFKLYN